MSRVATSPLTCIVAHELAKWFGWTLARTDEPLERGQIREVEVLTPDGQFRDHVNAFWGVGWVDGQARI